MKLRYPLIAATLAAGVALAATSSTTAPPPGEVRIAAAPSAAPASAAFSGGGVTPLVAGTPERMPANVDSSNQAAWWVPLALYNGATYFVYDSPDTADPAKHGLAIARRDSAGNWTSASLKNADGTPWTHQPDDIGHRAPTIAIDGDGYIHVWADMHNDNWRYFRSSLSADITDIRQRSDMPGSGAFTYPVAKTAPNGDVWLFLRNNASVGELHHWSNSANSWNKVSTFASSSGAVVYPDDLVFSADGTLNIVWEWAYNNPRGLRHYGSFLRYKPGTNAWTYIDGTAATVPVSLTSSPKLFYLPLQSGEVFTAPDTAKGLQSAKIALDPNSGWPSIAYRFRPTDGSGDYNFDVWRVRWNGSAWSHEKVYAASNDVPAGLGLTRNATNVRVYFATLGGGMQRALKTSTTPWAITALAPGKAIQRVNAAPLNDTTDILYGGAPTDVDANTGSVYWQSVSD